jgi:hypothetical protein
VSIEWHLPKYVPLPLADNPFVDGHPHMSNRTVLAADQQTKATALLPFLHHHQTEIALDLHDSHHHHELVKWLVAHEKG